LEPFCKINLRRNAVFCSHSGAVRPRIEARHFLRALHHLSSSSLSFFSVDSQPRLIFTTRESKAAARPSIRPGMDVIDSCKFHQVQGKYVRRLRAWRSAAIVNESRIFHFLLVCAKEKTRGRATFLLVYAAARGCY